MHIMLQRVRALSAAMLVAVGAGADAAENDERQATTLAYAMMADAELLLTGADSIEIQVPNGDSLVCRTEPSTRSHIPRRRCFTQKQLNRIMREAQEWMRTGGRDGYVYTTR